jgi:hypothetical protein
MDLKSIALLALLSISGSTFAADCGAPNQQFFDGIAVSMMWDLRGQLCPAHWSETLSFYTGGDWCATGGGYPYMGQFTITGMTSEQQCWVMHHFVQVYVM